LEKTFEENWHEFESSKNAIISFQRLTIDLLTVIFYSGNLYTDVITCMTTPIVRSL